MEATDNKNNNNSRISDCIKHKVTITAESILSASQAKNRSLNDLRSCGLMIMISNLLPVYECSSANGAAK